MDSISRFLNLEIRKWAILCFISSTTLLSLQGTSLFPTPYGILMFSLTHHYLVSLTSIQSASLSLSSSFTKGKTLYKYSFCIFLQHVCAVLLHGTKSDWVSDFLLFLMLIAETQTSQSWPNRQRRSCRMWVNI